eukprot:CAMPEP_0185029502 /NCGR_PEP_ID=MMETSP1103-20130426/15845_1 /TAXON_ID=36769 /ORGANISM="Paraphysomonas bandaiensis, Strain Caron Lab Isolate" /LENGTH=155 /DNA_ID=CAMNT_0027564273 /DNA_START=58 /DNA_END=522 /DNA_ORIENTATION=-
MNTLAKEFQNLSVKNEFRFNFNEKDDEKTKKDDEKNSVNEPVEKNLSKNKKRNKKKKKKQKQPDAVTDKVHEEADDSIQNERRDEILPLTAFQLMSYRDPELTDDERRKRRYGRGLNLSVGAPVRREDGTQVTPMKSKRNIDQWVDGVCASGHVD